MISVIVFKMGKHSDFHLSFFQIEGAGRDFTVVTKLMKNFKSLSGAIIGYGSWSYCFFMGMDTHLTQSTTKVTAFKQLKQVIHSNTDPRSGMRKAISPGQ